MPFNDTPWIPQMFKAGCLYNKHGLCSVNCMLLLFFLFCFFFGIRKDLKKWIEVFLENTKSLHSISVAIKLKSLTLLDEYKLGSFMWNRRMKCKLQLFIVLWDIIFVFFRFPVSMVLNYYLWNTWANSDIIFYSYFLNSKGKCAITYSDMFCQLFSKCPCFHLLFDVFFCESWVKCFINPVKRYHYTFTSLLSPHRTTQVSVLSGKLHRMLRGWGQWLHSMWHAP